MSVWCSSSMIHLSFLPLHLQSCCLFNILNFSHFQHSFELIYSSNLSLFKTNSVHGAIVITSPILFFISCVIIPIHFHASITHSLYIYYINKPLVNVIMPLPLSDLPYPAKNLPISFPLSRDCT